MIDTEYIKTQVDCRLVVERELGAPKRRSGKANLYPCPMHHESKGYSLAVYIDGWKCFGKCDASGDVFSWLDRRHGMSLPVAVDYLGYGRTQPGQPQQHRTVQAASSPVPSPAEWQRSAAAVIARAQDTLWSEAGRKAQQYLMETRGLPAGTIISAEIGYIPGNPDAWEKIEGLTCPTGITIPRYCAGDLWMVNVRRAAGQQKYQMISGSKAGGSLYWIDQLAPGLPVVFVEGEFDCLAGYHCGMDFASFVTLGSATNKLSERWYSALLGAPALYVLTDNDDAGAAAAQRLGDASARARRIEIPAGVHKDLNDLFVASGMDGVRRFLLDAITMKEAA